MNWIDIACIVFICVTANHLELVSTIERIIKAKLWIVDCPKCLTFWVTLFYGCHSIATHTTEAGIITVFAISFLASYAAIWLELIEGFIDTLYEKLYDTIYPTED